jgi:hypothetical protein
MSDAGARRTLESFARRARDQALLRRLDAAAVEAIAAFEGAGVDTLLLKGPALARALYSEGEHRSYSDVDLLVSRDRLDTARGVLAELGYVDISGGLGIDAELGGLTAETWTGTGGTPLDGLTVDLHWQLEGAGVAPEATWELLAAHRGTVEIDGRVVATLDTPGLAMHVAIHVAQHGPGYPQPVADLERALARWPPATWREAEARARELAALRAFAAGLRAIPAGAAMADSLGLPEAEAIDRAHRPRGTFHLDALARARTAGERAAVVRTALFPPREWIAWQYTWTGRRGPRLVAGYVVHVLRAPLWALRAWRFRRRD